MAAPVSVAIAPFGAFPMPWNPGERGERGTKGIWSCPAAMRVLVRSTRTACGARFGRGVVTALDEDIILDHRHPGGWDIPVLKPPGATVGVDALAFVSVVPRVRALWAQHDVTVCVATPGRVTDEVACAVWDVALAVAQDIERGAGTEPMLELLVWMARDHARRVALEGQVRAAAGGNMRVPETTGADEGQLGLFEGGAG